MATSVPVHSADSTQARAALAARLAAVRDRTVDLASPLSAEDRQVQSMADASPTKWHLAHTTWFFETFVLGPHMPGFACFDDDSDPSSIPTTRRLERGLRVPHAGF